MDLSFLKALYVSLKQKTKQNKTKPKTRKFWKHVIGGDRSGRSELRRKIDAGQGSRSKITGGVEFTG